MKSERSAGGVVACYKRNRWYLLLLQDRGGMWTFPKGLIQRGEQPRGAAEREIAEEVGIAGLRCRATLRPIRYWYHRGEPIRKTVTYFLFTTPRRRRPTPQKEEGIQDARWVPFEEAQKMIGYPKTHIPLLEEVWTLLRRRTWQRS